MSSVPMKSRSIDLSAFEAEVSPLTTPPSADKIFGMHKTNDSNQISMGHHVMGAFNTEVDAATVVIRTWYRKHDTTVWFKLEEATLTHRLGKTTTDTPRGRLDIYIQVISVANIGASTALTIYATEM